MNRGRFREDLYFRLAVITVRVPPLRERLDDLLILIRVFLAALGVPDQERLFPPPVLAEMAQHDWPGNVRELRNYVERTVVLQTASPTMPPLGAVERRARRRQRVDIRRPVQAREGRGGRHVRARAT